MITMSRFLSIISRPFRWFVNTSVPKKILAIVILAVLILSITSYFRSKKPSQVQFTTVQQHDIKQEVSASGTLSGENSTNLHFLGAGKLAYISVKVGDHVYPGQIIAGQDTQQLAINLQEAENTLRDKQATVDKTLDDIHLYQYGMGGFSNIGSANETETQRQNRTTAEAARDNAERAVAAAKRAYQDSVIVSPISGEVTQANPVAGQIVAPTDTIAQIVDFSQIIFAADVDEADVAKISTGQNAEVTLNAYGDKIFTGKVTEIVPTTHTTTNGATVVTVKIALDDQSIKPIAGLSGQGNIILSERNQVVSIPQDALWNGNTVFVKTPTGITPRKVTTGLQSDTDVEVTNGLSVGDQIVTTPSLVAKNQPSRNPLSRIFRR